MKLPEFFQRVRRQLGLDAAESKRTCLAVLDALFARLQPAEARHLASQLPHQLRDRFVVKRGFKRLSSAQLVERVADQLGCDDDEAVRRIRGVFDVVREAVSIGAVEHMLDQLPRDLVGLLQ
jgi:uncharacterized protein (DUF2267 family)